MFSGFQEILVIGLIIAGIIVLPRMVKPPSTRPAPQRRPVFRLDWVLRLSIVVSILWPAGWALYFEPWRPQNRIPFALVAIGPVVIGWCVKWVLAGLKNKR